MLRRFTAAVALAAALAACGADRPEGSAADQAAAAPADSAYSRDEALRRFRAGIPAVSALGGTMARDSLVMRFVSALGSADTAALADLMLSPAEFAYLYYPSSAQGLPPYDLPPELMWGMLVRQSDRGLADLLRRTSAGTPELVGYECAAEPMVEGENRIWGPCLMTLALGTDTLAGRLAGPVIERGGRFKFVSYTNDLD